jgi:hypothetical protein
MAHALRKQGNLRFSTDNSEGDFGMDGWEELQDAAFGGRPQPTE